MPRDEVKNRGFKPGLGADGVRQYEELSRKAKKCHIIVRNQSTLEREGLLLPVHAWAWRSLYHTPRTTAESWF